MTGSYERTAARLLRKDAPHVPTTSFINGKLLRGWRYRRTYREAYPWRLFWRLKALREVTA